MPHFKIGDRVTWSSQAGGYSKQKSGIVVSVVPKGVPVFHHSWLAMTETGVHDRNLDSVRSRDHESYIVHVPTKTGRGKGKLYWPAVNKLKLASEGNPYDRR